ncbi:hypothetical protein NE237_025705 [Protea cynaroides]|uniref:RNase H type-1 domain-containing protein n=1 Tax=Protea cynaroides TaxID=273540 RepID=A0A9Q0JZT4_9MAGN|nr:hypothetical protein NE237_025705 [Protea cynaroides]
MDVEDVAIERKPLCTFFFTAILPKLSGLDHHSRTKFQILRTLKSMIVSELGPFFLTFESSSKGYLQFGNLPRSHQDASSRQDHECWWIPPPSDYIKINTDASPTSNSSTYGLGFIFRDHNGTGIKAASISKHFESVKVGEALATRAAVVSMLEDGISNIHLQSDKLEIIQLLQNRNSVSELQ